MVNVIIIQHRTNTQQPNIVLSIYIRVQYIQLLPGSQLIVPFVSTNPQLLNRKQPWPVAKNSTDSRLAALKTGWFYLLYVFVLGPQLSGVHNDSTQNENVEKKGEKDVQQDDLLCVLLISKLFVFFSKVFGRQQIMEIFYMCLCICYLHTQYTTIIDARLWFSQQSTIAF